MSVSFAEPVFSSQQFYDDESYDDQPLLLEIDGIDFQWFSQRLSYCDDGVEICTIDRLENGYLVQVPIPVTIEQVDDHTYQAAFDEANIAITGFSSQDAYQSLIAEILDTFDALTAEQALGQHIAAQLAVLRRHIVKT